MTFPVALLLYGSCWVAERHLWIHFTLGQVPVPSLISQIELFHCSQWELLQLHKLSFLLHPLQKDYLTFSRLRAIFSIWEVPTNVALYCWPSVPWIMFRHNTWKKNLLFCKENGIEALSKKDLLNKLFVWMYHKWGMQI